MKPLYALLFTFILSAQGFSQSYSIKGTLLDAKDNSTLMSASVTLTHIEDASFKQLAATDMDGNFAFTGLKSGVYKLKFSYIGYSDKEVVARLSNEDKLLGKILLAQNEKTLNDVNIVEKAVRVEQKADTAVYNASSFKVNKDATTEDLVTKMPGVVNDNGTVKAQGEEVKKVLIDGKEYFGDDVNAALKNLPADLVDKVQVFDRMSDQAQFSGFDDGNSQKAMNITTKKGMNNGVFGKFYAGYGYLTDSRYSAGANVNWLSGNRRLSLISMSNNINQQNFSMQDLTGALGTSSSSGPGGMRGGGRGGRGGGGDNPANNFLVGQQNGIATTHAIGLNYSDVLGKKKNLKITGSYFFNYTDNSTQSELNRNYFSNGDSALTYSESSSGRNRNMNHRVNLRLQYDIDSVNTLIITPKFSLQQNKQETQTTGANAFIAESPVSSTNNQYSSQNKGYSFSTDILYRHRFKKPGNTISLNITPSINNKTNSTSQFAKSNFYSLNDSSIIDQKSNTDSKNYGVSGSINYTAPVGQKEIIQLNYTPSFTWSSSDKKTTNFDTATTNYSVFDTLLSNKYDNTYMTQRAGMSYSYIDKAINFSVGVNTQYAVLSGKTIFPYAVNTSRAFINVLPNLNFNYKFKKGGNIKVMYRTSTNPPSITQLQDVINVSNPLQLTAGNPNLKQNYTHFVMARYGFTNTKTAQSFFAFIGVNIVQNYVGNSIFIASKDTLLNSNVTLRSGSQIASPKNLNGNMSVNSFFTYGLPITAIKSNLNVNAGFSYSRTPSEINNQINFSNNYTPTAGLVLSSNISEKIDFTLSYMGSYTMVKNSLRTSSDNNYFTHNANLKFNWQFWKGFVFNTSLQNTLYSGISQGFNQNIFLWNAALGYKFLKDKSLEVKFGVNDIMNQNNGINRTVTETYVEDSRNKVLKRYWMMTVTYNLKYFKKTKSAN
jgi:hypothetical protein